MNGENPRMILFAAPVCSKQQYLFVTGDLARAAHTLRTGDLARHALHTLHTGKRTERLRATSHPARKGLVSAGCKRVTSFRLSYADSDVVVGVRSNLRQRRGVLPSFLCFSITMGWGRMTRYRPATRAAHPSPGYPSYWRQKGTSGRYQNEAQTQTAYIFWASRTSIAHYAHRMARHLCRVCRAIRASALFFSRSQHFRPGSTDNRYRWSIAQALLHFSVSKGTADVKTQLRRFDCGDAV